MVRNFPTRDPTSPHNQSISVTFIVAFVAAVVTIVSSLCGSTKKKQRRTPSRSRARPPLVRQETQTLDVRIEDNANINVPRSLGDPPAPPRDTNINNIKPLPPPPAMAKLRAASFHVRSNSNVSQKGKLLSSMSMRSIGGHKKASKKEAKHVKNNLSNEDSIWKKTIILGEKCRVPDEEEEAVVYDEKGMRIPTFHRKQSVGLQISRQNSTLESNGNPKEKA